MREFEAWYEISIWKQQMKKSSTFNTKNTVSMIKFGATINHMDTLYTHTIHSDNNVAHIKWESCNTRVGKKEKLLYSTGNKHITCCLSDIFSGNFKTRSNTFLDKIVNNKVKVDC